MNDSGGDGLYFWANTNQGTGYFRIRSASGGTVLKTFQTDFGDNINYQFTINYSLPVNEVAANKTNVTVFPNPSAGQFNLKISGQRHSGLNLAVTDITGRVIYTDKVWMAQSEQDIVVDLPGAAPGIYLLRISGDGYDTVQRIDIH